MTIIIDRRLDTRLFENVSVHSELFIVVNSLILTDHVLQLFNVHNATRLFLFFAAVACVYTPV